MMLWEVEIDEEFLEDLDFSDEFCETLMSNRGGSRSTSNNIFFPVTLDLT